MSFYKDKIWYFTFIAILLKCVIFIGFTLDKTHLSFNFYTAIENALPCLYYFFCFIAALLCFSFLFKNRSRLWYMIGVNLLVSILLLVDLWYYRGFNTMPSLNLLQQTSNLSSLSGSILSLIHLPDMLFVVDILFLVTFIIIKKDLYRKAERSILAFTLLFVLSVGIIAFIPMKVKVFNFKDPSIYYFTLYDADITTRALSPIGYHIFNIYTFWKDSQPYKLTFHEIDEIKAWYDAEKESIPDNKYKGIFKGKNLIVIQVESLENFMINHEVNNQEVTPVLNRLIKNGLYFPNIHEQVNHGQSSDADLMANTSIYPMRQASTFFSYPYNTYNSMPKLLKELGYYTIALHPDKGSYWNWMPALKSMGFDRCVDSSEYKSNEVIGMGISDGALFKEVEPILASLRQPFYAFAVTLSSHAPFDLPKQYRKLSLDPELDQTTMGGYFQSAHYVDEQIGNFLDMLDKDKLLDNSIVVIYGDHAGIHKFYPRDVQTLKNPENWWLDNHGEIPFIIYSKGFHTEEIKTIGGQIDFLPTIAYLMGVNENAYQNTAMGRNLLKTKKSFVVLKNHEYISDQGNEQYKDLAVQGLDIADIIIKSNYFKK